MTNKNIHTIRIIASGLLTDHIGADIKSLGLQQTRGPRCFSAGTLEYIDVIVTISATAIGAFSTLAGVLITRAKNRRIKVKFNDGSPVQEIEAGSLKELMEAYHTIQSIEIGRE
ncbi:hypothetical protein M976_02725 [Buttiauxella ferragutiae ATCC 51602]|uniref:Uncharacterized protein n=1 Tax=Buttiauxella ferragutiae ATCC 51602 TaxID=1354252 RepID=A0ABX2W6K1_9ENTR|nr:hypothetical protein [Buttiauxella ferragutiae]OAT26564.1 hypothetical protein M976_02725 [Buttiauxella ferragutiae ATCC 51602]